MEMIALPPISEANLNFDLETANGMDRLIAVSHHVQQKVCATVLQSSLIEQLLDRPELDVASVRHLLKRIMDVSYTASSAVSELQELVLEHLGGQDRGATFPLCDARAA
ncbi:hypothetical protein F1640_01625 [Novosphingobium sp. NBM11]|jgi:hypothetical protein|uniref:hypothetical protein n=1 Tax=unclassified Novosphingobium TaxID=2644732 RepID=UPI00061BA9B6|nr:MULTISPECIES: hypothetical protein [unclassified Novosphingobium]MBF5088760.1 hypothetical protein [Novosphingobium sp. NBM11]GAO56373.1 hypothetical protein NMD1_03536 [Novosphingobium sp. MD-1]